MRNIISISLPLPLTNAVDKEVKRGNYASKSEFFRYLLRQWMEEKTSHELDQSRKELQQGKGKILKSLEDLR
jgi:Arc/MetJ-type ribon-helix-helix transcriptional regulator